MKKVIFTLLSSTVLYFGASAQYCGSSNPSGSSQCNPSGTLTQPGLSPTSDSLPPFVNGVPSATVIQFKNFDTINALGQHFTIQQLKIDTISNLPPGLCWSTNKTNNTYSNQEDGCIKINGTPCGATGQYKLHITVQVDVGFGFLPYDADQVGLKYFGRLKNAADADTPVDTTQTSANPFIAYGGVCIDGINDVENTFNSLTVVPNPFTNRAIVSFVSDKAGIVTEKLTNIIGAEVYRNKFEAKPGENTSVISKNNLPAGVYFYSVTDGRVSSTRRVVISE